MIYKNKNGHFCMAGNTSWDHDRRTAVNVAVCAGFIQFLTVVYHLHSSFVQNNCVAFSCCCLVRDLRVYFHELLHVF